ncbi:MAG: SHOCT domain-containing protein [Alphaproteobacteria bacterium]|nr:SHOCT domain-containing protein [Alphaproteobacteria bacterium]MBM3733657.1 SHOCT domain-containing protein [Acidimicrobiia bacterium]
MDPSWAPSFGMFWIFPVLCLIFMGAMMFMMFRHGGGCMPMGRRFQMPPNGTCETPQQILDRRLASGEITLEQYASISRDLEASGGGR